MNLDIKVSISCLTYNHASFIRECLDGFLMQQCDFKYEVLIHDDASTDGTQEIIKEYQKKHPEIIKPIFRKENLYSKGERMFNARFNFPRAKGKYIALCEGDDYWTDPLKLQKQVNFLEANPEFAVTVGGFKKFNIYNNNSEDIIKIISGVKKNEKGYEFDLYDLKKGWITKTLTAVFRNNSKVFNLLKPYKYSRDIHLFYHLLRTGKGFYFTEVFGVYNIHEGGVNSMKQGIVNKVAAYNSYKELHLKNMDNFTRIMRFNHTLGLFNYLIKNKNMNNGEFNVVKLYFEAVFLLRKPKEIKSLLAAIIK